MTPAAGPDRRDWYAGVSAAAGGPERPRYRRVQSEYHSRPPIPGGLAIDINTQPRDRPIYYP